MTFKLALVIVSASVAVADAGPAKKKVNVAVTAPANVNVLALGPTSWSGSGPSLVKKVRAADAGRVVLYEEDGQWVVHYAIALVKPLEVPEIDLKISDVSGAKETIASRHKIVYSDAPVVRGSFTLTRDEVLSANAKLLLEIHSDGESVANRMFFIQSTAPATESKSIDFTAEEAAGADDADTKAVTTKRR